MIEEGWAIQKPQQAGLYRMRKIGKHEEQRIEVIPPDKFRVFGASESRTYPKTVTNISSYQRVMEALREGWSVNYIIPFRLPARRWDHLYNASISDDH